MALIWPGVPLIDWAIIRPWVSNMPQARSCLSRTIVLKAVRMSASCCSLATERKRFQITSKVTGSMASLFIGKLHDNIEPFIHVGMAPSAHDHGRLPLLDDRGAIELRARRKRVAIINRCIDIAAVFRKVG